MNTLSSIRNFSIIAHIDHGKSTLADRLLELTGAITPREFREQILDDMDLERERGITIKAHAVTTSYKAHDGHTYQLNLIDTPGHVDFTYEVSRSLAACEGALLLVDATQGVEAQTIANVYLAMANDLVILPVINKIDLPSADIDGVKHQIEEVLGLPVDDALLVSAKQGIGVDDVLDAMVRQVPSPAGSPDASLKALIFDSWFDSYQGAIVLVRIFDGVVKPGMKIRLMSTGRTFEVSEVGIFSPKRTRTKALRAGAVGYVVAGMKDVSDTKIGDTITEADRPTATPLPGYRDVKPLVFCGLYTMDNADYENLRDSLDKLRLNDSSFVYEPETSLALGFGFRCGFLGLLHMEIIRERLHREYGLSLISTAPTVIYRVRTLDGEVLDIENPSKLPEPEAIETMEEPFIKATMIAPERYAGNILALCQERRGVQESLQYLDTTRIMLVYALPLNEMVLDFYDKLKSRTQGYASLDYELMDYRESDLVKLDLLLNGETIDALSFITHKEKAYHRGRQLVEKMKELIPKQMFEVAIQAAIGKRVIARETVSAIKKNVTAKCYGGDITRKRKLWEKQKEGKKRMKQLGRVEVPQEAFLALLKVKDES
ncbi:MAG: elongation factor 4 [Nitrospira sp. SB0677_bin_15]|nr:elongation factor 4 [Nitrospira sp. SB0667_bin_9]MYD31356.1 elongation factor 4 [Nitrospira sp. SB0661_bin_20]MYG40065.1 elongation factor 4 [Nitrospira sp. SB0677_bin_15]MYH02853.1 elongation factor 4 [Nitrospira sp. SB0675_bin_23]MYJ22215.1 elongation factor 4 [Nitrospira sp. SB0673_bin_12]